MKKQILFAGAAAILTIAAAMPAAAQSIDYGSLETLFGEPVTTSATGSPQRSTEAPADMEIISADEIRRSGETSLPGILQRVAGIDVMNHSAGQTDVNVRGYNQVSSPRLLVLVNGRQVYMDHYGLTTWSALPVQLSEIRQIEVVKGPNSALFGFNAVSGVVNIITYNPKLDDTNVVSVTGGTGGYTQGSLVKTFRAGESLSARLSLGGRKADEWKRTNVLPAAGTLHDPESASANLDVVAQLAPKVELRMEGSWSNVQQDTATGGYAYAVTKMIATSAKATLSADTNYGLVQAQVYQNDLTAKYDLIGGINWKNSITVASVQDLFKVGAAHTIRIGGEYRHNTLNAQPIGGADVSYDVMSASGMWDWAISDKLSATTAVRVDKLSLERSGTFVARAPLTNNALWDRDVTKTSANVTFGWRPTSADNIRVSYGKGIQAPSLIEFGGIQSVLPAAPGLNIQLLGNPYVRPTTVTNYEIAYDHDFAPMKARVGVRVFAQDWKDIKGNLDTKHPDYFPTATSDIGYVYVNASDSKMKGAEVTASGRATEALGWRVNYTWTDIKDTALAGYGLEDRNVAFSETTPSGRGNIGVDWEKGPWEADANLHYVGARKLYDLTNGSLQPVDAFAALSARIGYRAENGMTIALAGQNLLKERQKQTRGLEAERRIQISISKAW